MNQPVQTQEPPGSTAEMRPRPDHGEESYRGSGRLEGKKAVIRGADSGIGRAVAIAFAREGADVLISYLNEDEDAEETARWVREAGRRAVLVSGDISKSPKCREIVERAVAEFGQIDVLVSNAAYQMSHDTLDEISDEEWEHTFATNVSAMFYLVKAALPHMLVTGSGHIVVMSSGAGLRSFPGAAAYSATKAAQRMFAEALRHELADTGVSLTTVYPGEIATSLHDHEKDRMPSWYRGGPEAAPAAKLAAKIVEAVEEDKRALYYPPIVRLLGILHNVTPKGSDAFLRRLRGASAAPRRD